MFHWLWKRIAKELEKELGYGKLKIELCHYILSGRSIETWEKMIDVAKKNRKNKGHSDYYSLAQMWVDSYGG